MIELRALRLHTVLAVLAALATLASRAWAAAPGPVVGPEFEVEAPLSAGANSDYPDVTWNGSAFVVLYGNGTPGQSMGFAASKVDPVDAKRSRPGVHVVSGAIGRARIASNGPEHLEVWAEAGDIKAVRLDSSGTLTVGTPFVVSSASGDQSEPAVAGNGSEFLVTWTDTRSGNADVFGARVDASGVVYDPNGIPIFVGADEQSAPSVAWDGF